MRLALLATVGFVGLTSCATYSDELSRGQTAFEQNQHKRALAIFRGLEADGPHLTAAEQAQYAYLRGMTDYRIGYKGDARHWLIVAKALESQTPNSLSTEWKARMNEVVAELNEEVYGGGVESLTNARKAKGASEPPAKRKNAEEP